MRTSTVDAVVQADRRLGYVDLTDDLRRAIKDSGVAEGCVVAFCPHTTAALLLGEWEEGALHDLRARLEVLVPEEAEYAHDDLDRRRQNLEEGHERPNGRSHVAHMLLGGSSHAIPVIGEEPALGRWQRLLLLELDQPKERRVLFHVFGN